MVVSKPGEMADSGKRMREGLNGGDVSTRGEAGGDNSRGSGLRTSAASDAAAPYTGDGKIWERAPCCCIKVGSAAVIAGTASFVATAAAATEEKAVVSTTDARTDVSPADFLGSGGSSSLSPAAAASAAAAVVAASAARASAAAVERWPPGLPLPLVTGPPACGVANIIAAGGLFAGAAMAGSDSHWPPALLPAAPVATTVPLGECATANALPSAAVEEALGASGPALRGHTLVAMVWPRGRGAGAGIRAATTRANRPDEVVVESRGDDGRAGEAGEAAAGEEAVGRRVVEVWGLNSGDKQLVTATSGNTHAFLRSSWRAASGPRRGEDVVADGESGAAASEHAIADNTPTAADEAPGPTERQRAEHAAEGWPRAVLAGDGGSLGRDVEGSDEGGGEG